MEVLLSLKEYRRLTLEHPYGIEQRLISHSKEIGVPTPAQFSDVSDLGFHLNFCVFVVSSSRSPIDAHPAYPDEPFANPT